MSRMNECEICTRAVEEQGLDMDDYESLRRWHAEWHR